AQCALAVQAAMRGRAAPETSPLGRHGQLRLKVGIGAGEVVTVHVGGGYGRWEVVVAGDPLGQMSAAVHHAQPGDVILSPEAWALVDEWCEGTPIGNDTMTRRQGDRLTEVAGITLSPLHLVTPSPVQAVRLRDVRDRLPLRVLERPALVS